MKTLYLYAIALFCILALIGAGLYLSENESEDKPITVTLLVFSGRPDPTWEISNSEEVSRLYEFLELLPVAENPSFESPLGYRGFALEPVHDPHTNEEGTLTVWKGIIEFRQEGTTVHYADARGLESFLFEMARARGFGDLIPPAEILTFEDCAKAGYPILESYPRQCVTPDGKAFVENIDTVNPTVPPQLPNPASVYCGDHGGRLEIRTDVSGGQYGVCVFPDGTECEEWAYFRGECHGPETSCGNGICEGGEGDWCPPCTYATPPCLAPCQSGTCPQDCADSKLSFRVSECLRGVKGPEVIQVSAIDGFIFLSHHLNYVCCAKMALTHEILMGSPQTIKIVERNTGGMCKCLCDYDIQARIGPLQPGTYSVEVWGVEYGDSPATLLFTQDVTVAGSEFCGSSTLGMCFSDADCMKGGCSGQICQSRYEEPRITTCEYKECYDAGRYGYGCRCIQGKCQWQPASTFMIV